MIINYITRFKKAGNMDSLLANISYSAFGFAIFLVLTRNLSQTEFGQWVLFITIVSLMDMLRLGLSGTATIRLLSSSNQYSEKEIKSSSYYISFLATIIIAVAFIIIYILLSRFYQHHSYIIIFKYYPLLAIANLPLNQALIIAQGKVNFKRVLVLRTLMGVFSFLGILIFILSPLKSMDTLILFYIASIALGSFIVMMMKWDGFGINLKHNRQIIANILNFGKYSTASYVGSNLLRSTDTILLGLFPFMGSEAIATLAIPFKFVELVEIPLRSFTATALPYLSSIYQNKKVFLKQLLNYTGWSTLMLLPASFALMFFPEFFLKLLAGSGFAVEGIHIKLVFILSFYMLILPLDRYSGVALFAQDKPKQNFRKILLMLTANVLMDLIAIVVFKSLILVAVATVAFTLMGIFIGWIYVISRAEWQSFIKLGINIKTHELIKKKHITIEH